MYYLVCLIRKILLLRWQLLIKPMNNKNIESQIKNIFCETLGVKPKTVTDKTAYNSFEPWDSLKHLQFISRVEEKFGINIEMNDVIAMNTFKAVKDTLLRYLAKKS